MFRSRKEMQSLIDSSRKSLAEAELQIAERNKLIKNEIAEKEQLKSKIKDLENNIEFLVNNLSAKKRELVQPSHQNYFKIRICINSYIYILTYTTKKYNRTLKIE